MEKNLARIFPHFNLFVGVSRQLELDGYVIELSSPEFGQTLERLCSTVRGVLSYFSDRDPLRLNCMKQEIEDPSWWFSFDGERMFLLAFAPCYEPRSSRCSGGYSSTFLLFQPEHTFDRAVPPGETRIPDVVRQDIRNSFAQADQPYDSQISQSYINAYKFVKPLRLGDPVVKWWLEDSFPDET